MKVVIRLTSGQVFCASANFLNVGRFSTSLGMVQETSDGSLDGAVESSGAISEFGTDDDIEECGTGLERASATVFCDPGRCVSLLVNSEMKARWRCCLADQGGEVLKKAVVSGL